MQSFSVKLGFSRPHSNTQDLNSQFFPVGDMSFCQYIRVILLRKYEAFFFLGFGSRVGVCFWFHKDATSLTYSETVVDK
jgi:hypothetical protein